MEISPLMQQMLDIVIPAVVGVLGLALTAFTRRLTQEASARVKHQAQREGLERLEQIVSDAVAEAEQTLVAQAKAAASDGKLTAEDGERVKASVVDVVRRHLGVRGLAELSDLLGTVVDDGRIRTLIEADLLDRKAE